MRLTLPTLLTLAIANCAAVGAETQGWTGKGPPPDCWDAPRIYHEDSEYSQRFVKQVRFEHISLKPLENRVYSANKSYYFVKEGVGKNATITVFADKELLLQISFIELAGVNEVRWINEKLLYFRAWWGRVVASDFIYDVDSETIVYHEQLVYGQIAFEQYQQGCKHHGGCKCIKKTTLQNESTKQ